MPIAMGQVLLGQFRVDDFIGSGGMGVVYRVWDLKRNAPLAMKVLHADLADEPSVLKRFKREARALRKLAHPHIVPFYGLHELDGLAFLLERFIDGPSLKELLRKQKGRPIPPNEMLVYLKAVSSALGYAHAHGVVHCDVKPGNVMIDRGGSIFLTDFGVARHAESTTTTLGIAGTAAYMAPEQCRAEPVTPETDIYALGVVLFELATGGRPFHGNEEGTNGSGSTGAERVRFAHVHLAPPDPVDTNPNISRPLADVILKALSKEPSQRYRTMMELYQAVSNAIGMAPENVGDRVRLPASIATQYPAPSAGSGSSVEITQGTDWIARFLRALQIRGRPQGIILAGAAGIVVLIGLLAFAWVSSGDGEPEPEGLPDPTAAGAIAPTPTLATARSQPTRTAQPTPNLIATDAAATVVAALTHSANEAYFKLGTLYQPLVNCPESRIRVGNWTRVSLIPPKANRIRMDPGIEIGTVIGHAEPGTVLQVLDGPECATDMIWWWVRSQDGQVEGWTAEGVFGQFYLDPGSLDPP